MSKSDFGDDLAARLSRYGGKTVSIVERLPSTKSGTHIGSQLMRSATSAGANYEEARGSHSRKEFIYRVSLALKETRESLHWIRVVEAAGWQVEGIRDVYDEGTQLVRILAASKATAERNRDG